MPSTFLGLTIASSGISTYNTAITVTGNNIANVETKGYTRQEVRQTASEALRAYTTYGQIGTGVKATGIEQIRNRYYDTKYWSVNTQYGEYDSKDYYMKEIEYVLKEDPKTSGYMTAFNKFFNSLDEASKKSLDVPALTQFVNDAQTFAEYFNNLSVNFENLQEDLNHEVKTYTNRINTIAQQIYSLNNQINVSEVAGGDASTLRDQRALLIDELSEIVPVEVEETKIKSLDGAETGATNYSVSILGQKLVDNDSYNQLECVARTERVNQSDVDGLYDLKWSNGNRFNASSGSSGRLKALFDLRDGNNADNFQGSINNITTVDANNTLVTISSSTYDNLDQMNLNGVGTIQLGRNEYSYDSVSALYNSSTGEYEYTFNITGNSALVTPSLVGQKAVIGSSVDYCGIPYYMSQMNEFARNFAKTVNSILVTGFNSSGNVGGILFTGTSASGDEYDFALSGTVSSITQSAGISTVQVAADAGETSTPQDTGSIYINGVEYKYDSYTYNSSTNIYSYQISGNVDTSLVGKNADNYSLVQSNQTDGYNQLTAGNLKVSKDLLDNPEWLGTTTDPYNNPESGDILSELYKIQEDTSALSFRGGTASEFLVCLTSDSSVDAEKAHVFSGKSSSLLGSITNQRLSVSGVDNDEEGVNLIKFQNAYNLSCQVVSVLEEMYDKLINQTGV